MDSGEQVVSDTTTTNGWLYYMLVLVGGHEVEATHGLQVVSADDLAGTETTTVLLSSSSCIIIMTSSLEIIEIMPSAPL